MAKVPTSDSSEHDISLNFSRRPGRVAVVSNIGSILNQAAEIKTNITANV